MRINNFYYIPGWLIIVFLYCLAGHELSAETNHSTQPADHEQFIFTPPPRTIDDLLVHMIPPQIPATADFPAHCNGRSTDDEFYAVFKDILAQYEPHELIDHEKTPLPYFTAEYGWELYGLIGRLEIRRGYMDKAEKSLKQYLTVIPSEETGKFIRAYSWLALAQVARAKMVDAEASIANAKDWYSRLSPKLSEIRRKNALAWLQYAEASLALAKGDIGLAERLFSETIRNFEAFKASSPLIAIFRSKFAEAAALQGDLIRAENEIRLSVQHSIDNDRLGNDKIAPTLFRFAKILLDQGRVLEAEKLALAAVWSYQVACSHSDSIDFAYARRMLAEIYTAQERYDEVLKIYKAIERSMGADNQVFKKRFSNDLIFSYAELSEGKLEEGLARLENTFKQYTENYGPDHQLTAEAQGFLAIAQWKTGGFKQAEQNFSQAIKVLRNPKSRAGVSPHNVKLITESYMEMVSEKKNITSTDINTIFLLSEQARNSTVERSIQKMGARAATGSPALAETLRQEQDARIRITALESTLSVAIAEGTNYEALRKEINKLSSTRAQLLDKIERNFPKYFELLNPPPLGIDQVSSILRDGEALISIYSGANKTYVWSITKDKPAHFFVSSLENKKISRLVDKLYSSFVLEGDSIADIKPFSANAGYILYKGILEPAKNTWGQSHTLYIAANGPLGRLPFTVLPTKKLALENSGHPMFSQYRNIPYLVKTHAVSNIPSVNALRALRALEGSVTRSRQPFIAFGDPLFNESEIVQSGTEVATRGGVRLRSTVNTSGLASANLSQLPRLPGTADELMDIADALKVNTDEYVYLGKKANEQNVKSINLDQFQAVAFATHGLVPGDLDGLTQPALAMTAPSISKTKGDGLLTMDEIMNLKLNAEWVILSACNTGSGGTQSSEAFSGLGQAFFYAGARSLLVSNWPVETTSARLITTGIFDNATHVDSRAKSLKESIVNLINDGNYTDPESGEIIFSYAHPFFWAPFSLVGDILASGS